ncbi:MAG: tail fiber domain-containing protein [Cytophagales bacterium]
MHKILLLTALFFILDSLYAQNNTGIGTITPNPNALLELDNNGSPLGLLLPRQDISTFTLGPTDFGMMVFNTVDNKVYMWDGTAWVSATSEWAVNGTDIYNLNSGNVGIGTTNPQTKLQVEATGSFAVRLRSTESNSSAYSELEFGRDNGVGGFFKTGGIGTPGSGDYLQISSPQFIQFLTNFSPRMTISNAGNVTLGSGASSDLLNVNEGNITMFRSDGNDLELTFEADNNGIPWTIGVDDAANADFIISQGNNLSNPKLFISSGNAVGIGLSTPVNRLDVEGGAAIGSGYAGTITAPANGLVVQGNVGIGSNNPLYPLVVSGQTELAGNVGIGAVPDPSYDLFISSGASSSQKIESFNSSLALFSSASSSIILESGTALSGTNTYTISSGTGGLFVIGQQVTSGMLLFRHNIGGSLAVLSSSHFGPYANAGLDLGSASFRWNRVYYTTGILGTSDRKYKNNISSLQYGLNEIMRLNPVSFQWKEFPEQGQQLGLIAQEVQAVLPEVVEETSGQNKDLLMNHMELIPVMIKGMQELKSENERLKERIEALENN